MKKQSLVFAPATFNLAETTRMLEIAKEMRIKYDCIFFGFSKKYAEIISQNNFPFELLEPVFSEKQVQQIMKLDQGKGLKNPFTTKVVQQRITNELQFLEKYQPAVIVTGTNVTIFLSARIANIPLVYVKPYALTRPQLEENNRMTNRIMLSVKWLPRAFRQAAKKYQLSLPQYSIDLLDGDQNFITTALTFYNTAKLPENYHATGPIFARLSEELPAEIASFIQNAREQNGKLVYFATGSSGNKKIVDKVLSTLSKENFYVIAPVANYLEDTSYSQAENILCTSWLPAHLVAPLVDFSILHGGEGTIQTACCSGKPFLAFGLQAEQKINIQYCVNYGSALQIKPREIGRQKFLTAIKEIQLPNYLERAQELKENFPIDGAAKAAALIEKLYL